MDLTTVARIGVIAPGSDIQPESTRHQGGRGEALCCCTEKMVAFALCLKDKLTFGKILHVPPVFRVNM